MVVEIEKNTFSFSPNETATMTLCIVVHWVPRIVQDIQVELLRENQRWDTVV